MAKGEPDEPRGGRKHRRRLPHPNPTALRPIAAGRRSAAAAAGWSPSCSRSWPRDRRGYGLIGQLQEMGVGGEDVDVGQVYKTLRDLEAVGEVASTWPAEPTGPQRRDYVLTEAGWAALDEWAAVMRERRAFDRRFRGALP